SAPMAAGPVESRWDGFAGLAETAAVVPAAEPLPTVDRVYVLTFALHIVYVAVVLVLFVWLVVRLAAIGRLRRQARLTRFRDYVLAEHAAVRTPFSFLRTVYLGDGFDARRRAIVLQHEASHVRHRHSVERIAMEAMLCVLWFNPFAWLAARRLREVQEWEADRDVLASGCDLTEYRMTLFSQLFGYNPDMTCGLSHSFTKKRFLMMTCNKRGRLAGWRLAAALPFVGGMLCLCGFTVRESEAAGCAGSECRSSAPNPQIFVAGDGSVTLDGNAVTFEVLESRLESFRAGLSGGELAALQVVLSGAPSAPMAAVAEVKEILRRVPFLRIRYCCEDNSVSRMLPP
ncbi:MAG: M48 family metalloprotease, partial [Alistipes sp.]|nr:M48 family metalloprotease [Alistipes sp.]